jgi:septum formation protein
MSGSYPLYPQRRPLLLASASPRRAELLRGLGVAFDVCNADVDESARVGETPVDYASRLARSKALGGYATNAAHKAAHEINSSAIDTPALGADTIVTIDGELLGKPADEAAAHAMWQKLSGKAHEVVTAVALVDANRQQVMAVTTRVWFTSMSKADMRAYWHSGEPRDKAGAYGIQGLGGAFVERIEGSYSAVVGLPVHETWQLLRDFGVLRS